LKTKNPITDEDIILTDIAEFEVQPLEIYLDPAQRVIDFNKQKELPLKLTVKAGTIAATNPGEPFSLGAAGQKAVVEPIEWSLVKAPENCATADFDPKSFFSCH